MSRTMLMLIALGVASGVPTSADYLTAPELEQLSFTGHGGGHGHSQASHSSFHGNTEGSHATVAHSPNMGRFTDVGRFTVEPHPGDSHDMGHFAVEPRPDDSHVVKTTQEGKTLKEEKTEKTEETRDQQRHDLVQKVKDELTPEKIAEMTPEEMKETKKELDIAKMDPKEKAEIEKNLEAALHDEEESSEGGKLGQAIRDPNSRERAELNHEIARRVDWEDFSRWKAENTPRTPWNRHPEPFRPRYWKGSLMDKAWQRIKEKHREGLDPSPEDLKTVFSKNIQDEPMVSSGRSRATKPRRGLPEERIDLLKRNFPDDVRREKEYDEARALREDAHLRDYYGDTYGKWNMGYIGVPGHKNRGVRQDHEPYQAPIKEPDNN